MHFLLIQTAFIGDAILATAALESLKKHHPTATIDFLVRKGTESLFQENPNINKLLVFDKKNRKLFNLWQLAKQIRKAKYTAIFNLHRFASTGFLCLFSGTKTYGFAKNPLAAFYTKKFEHTISASPNGMHEVERNQQVIAQYTSSKAEKPKLYPSAAQFEKVQQSQAYVCMAPASVWFTKQFAQEKWIELVAQIPENIVVKFIGAPTDVDLCNAIISASGHKNAQNLCGKLSLIESAALMSKAKMNFVNDSAPMHLASSMNAPVTALYCSTVPEFGFGPLSDQSFVFQYEHKLDCRPCGLHGHKTCPKGHFNCSNYNTKNILLKTGILSQ